MNSIRQGVLGAALAMLAAVAYAQSFPDRPVKVIIPYAPGGGTDNLIRTIAPTISASMGQQLVIENRPGGNTFIGTELVTKAAPDGYTIMATDTALVVNPGLFRSKVPFDTAKSLTGVTMMAYAPVLLVIHPSVPATTLPEMLAIARAKPGTLTYASGGSGTSTHLAAELMKLAANVNILHIPYKGTGPAMTDLLGGQVSMQFAGISSARSHVEAGRLRALAVTSRERNPAMPTVPTFEEFGLKGVDADSYWGVYAPSATPPAVLAALNRHFVAAVRSPAHAERLASLGYLPIANTQQEHTQQMQAMIARWIDVIDKLKITSE
jgi:tripartite-type tricarboxylate transporter receptor subunit TctC